MNTPKVDTWALGDNGRRSNNWNCLTDNQALHSQMQRARSDLGSGDESAGGGGRGRRSGGVPGGAMKLLMDVRAAEARHSSVSPPPSSGPPSRPRSGTPAGRRQGPAATTSSCPRFQHGSGSGFAVPEVRVKNIEHPGGMTMATVMDGHPGRRLQRHHEAMSRSVRWQQPQDPFPGDIVPAVSATGACGELQQFRRPVSAPNGRPPLVASASASSVAAMQPQQRQRPTSAVAGRSPQAEWQRRVAMGPLR